MANSSQLFLAPCASSSPQAHFESTVSEPVPAETYTPHLEEVPKQDLRIWGVSKGNEATWQSISPGDFLIFYMGEGEYRYAAEVIDTEHNPALARDVWPDFVEQSSGGDDATDPYEYLIYLKPPFKVDIDSSDIHGLAGHDQNYPLKFMPLNDEGLEAIRAEYGGVEEYLRESKSNLTVWIEKTQIGDREYKQEGRLELGKAIMAPSKDKAGGRRYEELREADEGDIVLHLLQEQYQIVGVSVIGSELIDDFTGPPDNRWSDEQQKEGGYLRWLSNYEGIEPHIHVYDDILENPEYEQQLLDILEGGEKLFYSNRLSLNQGHYFTRCPDELVEILVNESVHLQELLESRGYEVEEPTPLPDDKLPKPRSVPKEASTIERQLEKNGQVVFYGPPGTGKTYTARQFAHWWLHQQSGQPPTKDQLESVTFHPSFSYEDFLEGLTAEAQDGMVEYQIKDGIFKSICGRAEEAYKQVEDDSVDPPRYVLIIDEINRGNLSQIFGETMTSLESDKRLGQESEMEITLAHSGEKFTIPPNLYVIGTMNTADRSIALVDAALRRRFRFISFPPDYTVLFDHYDFDDLSDVRETAQSNPEPFRSLLALSILALRGLNDRIIGSPDLGKGKQIGHSRLMNHEDAEDVLDAWKYEILPDLEEYYFGQFDRIREDLFDGTGDRLFHWEHEEIADFTADELRRTLADLEGISLAQPETETDQDVPYTIELLLDTGVVEPGQRLVFDETKVPDEADQPYDGSDPFWQCEVTGKTGQSDNMRWLHNDEEYSLSGLARTILEQVSEHSGGVTGPDYWQHPGYPDRVLAQLRTDIQSGQIDTDEQATD